MLRISWPEREMPSNSPSVALRPSAVMFFSRPCIEGGASATGRAKWNSSHVLAPIGGWVTGDWLRWGVMYLLCAVQVGGFSRRVGTFHGFSALLYPLPLVFFFAVFARSAMRSGKAVHWKGREIRAD